MTPFAFLLRKALDVVAFREAFGKDGTWYWRLPDDRPPGKDKDRQSQGVAAYGKGGGLWRTDESEGGADAESHAAPEERVEANEESCPRCGGRLWRSIHAVDRCGTCHPPAS